MAVAFLPGGSGTKICFPSPHQAERDGLLAVGGNLHPDTLIAAYRSGIFPWYSDDRQPVLWWSPNPRMILQPEWLHLPRTLRKSVRQGRFVITFDRAFAEVMRCCAAVRPDQTGGGTSWITANMQQAYCDLHHRGVAHSVEAWLMEDGQHDPVLAGGLYGVALGGCFFGESMFYKVPDASKVAFVTLVHQLGQRGFCLIDCQVHTPHLARFGARAVPLEQFLQRLQQALAVQPDVSDLWRPCAAEAIQAQ
ncbi:MAG: leucyl/phenylalanyl-tRNA--protein transferase [Magnetococcales bacterium]|nr:leucyl/phenylalanyl-tRNA--protein transferase [Magnetococcales bacterium]